MYFLGHFNSAVVDDFYYVAIFSIESLLNLTIPYFYINSKPNLKEYVSKSLMEGLNNVISYIALFTADVITKTYNFTVLLKPSPRVHPIIE